MLPFLCNTYFDIWVGIHLELWGVSRCAFFFVWSIIECVMYKYLILACFSKNGTCCYMYRWDSEQKKCLRKWLKAFYMTLYYKHQILLNTPMLDAYFTCFSLWTWIYWTQLWSQMSGPILWIDVSFKMQL